jgi:hypothetical protein
VRDEGESDDCATFLFVLFGKERADERGERPSYRTITLKQTRALVRCSCNESRSARQKNLVEERKRRKNEATLSHIYIKREKESVAKANASLCIQEKDNE